MTNKTNYDNSHRYPPTELELQLRPSPHKGDMMVEESDTNDRTDDPRHVPETEEELYLVRPEHDRKYAMLPVVGDTLVKLVRRFKIRDSYRITNRRIVIEHDGGLFGTDTTKEYPLRSVADIESYSTFTQRQHDCGTVTFTEHDGEESEVKMEWIPDHEEIADTIRRLATEEQARHRTSGNPDSRGW